jgi:indolepyruvate ferredoxin oxidoreductase, beta subunit
LTTEKPINIAILAMGGEGGGVLADWLVHVGEESGYLAQATSVPGVAQRTGATIYYLELFPRSALGQDGRLPVLGLMPFPGDIDLVAASELMEAGRAVQRGLVTPERTHLVASTHRVYSMTERIALGDGRVDPDAIMSGCRGAALSFTGFDMANLAERNGSVISAVLLGAIAGSQSLPFSRESYEGAIGASGISVGASLAAFSAGYAASQGQLPEPLGSSTRAPNHTSENIRDAVRRLTDGEARELVLAGVERAADYQDLAYARKYLDQLLPFIDISARYSAVGQQMLCEIARQLALGMTYEDTIRVAELKIRAARFERVRKEVGADPDQIVEIVEFMHPRVEEIADTMPAPIGRWLLGSKLARSVLTSLTSRGRMVRTTSLGGFLLLYTLASLKRFRRSTLRFARETNFLDEWLLAVQCASDADVTVAIELARLRNLVKGYGDTYERGLQKYRKIRSFAANEIQGPRLSESISHLIAAAQRDEFGEALDQAIHSYVESRAT